MRCAIRRSTIVFSGSRLTARRLAEFRSEPGSDHRPVTPLTAEQKTVYNSLGPARYDHRFNFDGINGLVVIPPAYGLLGVNRIIYTGYGDDIA
jgi:hypothetical protein